MTHEEIREAAQTLSKSGRGQEALRRVLDWLETNGLGLDQVNQEAIVLLLQAAWGGYAGTVREAMHEALDESRASA